MQETRDAPVEAQPSTSQTTSHAAHTSSQTLSEQPPVSAEPPLADPAVTAPPNAQTQAAEPQVAASSSTAQPQVTAQQDGQPQPTEPSSTNVPLASVNVDTSSDPSLQNIPASNVGQPDPIEAENFDSSDSALGDEISSVYTESLRSSMLQSVQENGRGYHRYRDGQYFIPEDGQEQERLDMQHEIFLRTMNRALYHSPLPPTVQHVLDIGTGTGIWPIDFADLFPDANVIGTDLSAIQPTYVPPNCKFEVDDFDQPWTFTQKFDYIHGRMLAGSVGGPEELFAQAYAALAPGGWFELQDFAFPVRADDGTMAGTEFERLNNCLMAALSLIGRDGGLAEKFKSLMETTGFANVTEIRYKWPQNRWPKDRHLKMLGQWNMINTLDGLHGFSARLCTQVLGMSNEELEVLLAGSRKNIQNPKCHAYWPIFVTYGQKPYNA